MSDPQPIKDILPAVMADIDRHMDAAARRRQTRTIEAMRDFFTGTARGGRQRPGRARPAEGPAGLFEDHQTGAQKHD
jgi:hypothetical protein